MTKGKVALMGFGGGMFSAFVVGSGIHIFTGEVDPVRLRWVGIFLAGMIGGISGALIAFRALRQDSSGSPSSDSEQQIQQ